MGKIKKILEKELVGGTQAADIYPVTSTKAVYDGDNKPLQDILNDTATYNVDANIPLSSGFYTSIIARRKIPSDVRKTGLIITYKIDSSTSITEQFLGTDVSDWDNASNWTTILTSAGLAQKLGNSEEAAMSQKAVGENVKVLVSNSLIDSSTISPVSLIPLTQQGFYDKTTGDFVSGTDFKSVKIECKQGEIYNIEGYVQYSRIAAIILYDEFGSIHNLFEGGSSPVKVIANIQIPLHITHVAFSFIGSHAASVKKCVPREGIITSEQQEKVYGVVDANYEYESPNMTQGLIMSDGTINTSTYPEEFSYCILELNYGDIVKVNTKLRGNRVAGVVYYNEDNEVMKTDFVGSSWTTYIDVDTYIVCTNELKKVGITIRTGGIVKKYTNIRAVDIAGSINNTILGLFDLDSLNKENLQLTKGTYYNYKDVASGEKQGEAFSGLKIEASEGDMFSFKGTVAYSAIAAVAFVDNKLNTISYLYGDNTSSPVSVNTGIITAPAGCAYVVFGAYTAYGAAEVIKYTLPKVITPNSIGKYLSTKYSLCNPYHYNVIDGEGAPSDIISSGFTNNHSNTPESFVIHAEVFKSYRRIFEWKIKTSSSSSIKIGTTSSSNSIVVSSRHSYNLLNFISNKLFMYTSEGTLYKESSIPFSVNTNDTYVVRCEQDDYLHKVCIYNERTLEGVCIEETATPQVSKCGKYIGRPFIQLISGDVTIVEYNTFLMLNPTCVFVGDSITECGYRQDTYAAKIIKNNLNNDGCIIAQGGATVDSLNLSRDSEIIYMKPKFLSLLAGTNGTITQAQINSWKTFCKDNNIIFILNKVPVSKNVESYPWESKNQVIRSANIIGANFDYATSLSNDPNSGANNSLFGDDVHPNELGQGEMYKRFITDVILLSGIQ